VFSVDSLVHEDSLRAADALIVVGQLLAAVEAYTRAATEQQRADAAATMAGIVGRARRRAVIMNPDDYRKE